MADTILHSGEFVDKFGNDIIITFYEKEYVQMMVVEPTELGFNSVQETKTLRVSGYTGTLNIDIPGAWLSYTSETSGSVTTYTLTTTQNQTTTVRRTTITLTDDNSTIYVEAVQAGTASSILINPSYISVEAEQTIATATLVWSGGTTPTYTSPAAWIGVTTTTSGNTMTVTLGISENTGDVRSEDITFTNGISNATLHITQNAASVLYALPNMISFDAEGESETVTAYWTGDVTPTYSFSPSSASNWLSQVGDPQSSGSKQLTWTFRADANPDTNIREASIIFTADGLTATVDVTQAGIEPATISVDKVEIEDISANGATDIITITYSGQGYVTPSGYASWVSVTYKDAPTATTVRFDINVSQNVGSARNTTITWTGSLGGTATTTLSQLAPATAWSVSPSIIDNVAYSGSTYNLSFVGSPTIGMNYELYPSDTYWVSASIQDLSTATVTVDPNHYTTSRSATVKFYKMDEHYVYVPVSIAQEAGPPAALHVFKPSMSFDAGGGSDNTFVENIVGTLTITPPEWITISTSGSGGTRDVGVHASANTSSIARADVVVFDDDRQSPVTMSVNQAGNVPTLSVSPTTIAYNPQGGTNGINAYWTVTAPDLELTYVEGDPGWLTVQAPSDVQFTRSWAITATPNSTGNSRTAKLTISNGGEPIYVIISQASASFDYYVKWTPSSLSSGYITLGDYPYVRYYLSDYPNGSFSTYISYGLYVANISGMVTLETNIPNMSGGYIVGGCPNLEQVRFTACSRLYSHTIGTHCPVLSSIYLDVCTKIDDYAFDGMSQYYFDGSSPLTTITLGYIGDYSSNPSVTTMYSSALTYTGITSSTGSLYVPSSRVTAYQINYTSIRNRIFPIPQ